ncbi:MAG: hypothetical protein ACTSUV_07135 [Candidatus Ranarchaeia archaeon]
MTQNNVPKREWKVKLPKEEEITFIDSTRLMGRYVIRDLYLQELSKRGSVITTTDFSIIGPDGLNKALEYYAIVKYEKIPLSKINEPIYGIFEKGYAGIRLLAMYPSELIDRDPMEILNIIDEPIVGNKKIKSWILVTPDFPLKR